MSPKKSVPSNCRPSLLHQPTHLSTDRKPTVSGSCAFLQVTKILLTSFGNASDSQLGIHLAWRRGLLYRLLERSEQAVRARHRAVLDGRPTADRRVEIVGIACTWRDRAVARNRDVLPIRPRDRRIVAILPRLWTRELSVPCPVSLYSDSSPDSSTVDARRGMPRSRR